MHTDDGLTPQVGIAELIAGSDTLAHDLVTPPASAPEVCPLCHSWKADSPAICDSCEVTGRAVKFPIGPISVITLTSKPSALRDWLTRYKGRPGDDDPFEQESYQRVRAIAGRYLLEHGTSLGSKTCGVDAVVVVPSAGARPVPHPLEQILSELSFAAPIERLLTRGPDALNFRVSAANGYLCDAADQPRRVLLVEDVFVTGARIFSAAHAIQRAGHIVAGALVLARRVNRDWGGSQAMWMCKLTPVSPGAPRQLRRKWIPSSFKDSAPRWRCREIGVGGSAWQRNGVEHLLKHERTLSSVQIA